MYLANEDIKILPNRKMVALIGDARMGVPFFKSLHYGLLCASRLVQFITDENIDSYTRYSKGISRIAMNLVRAENKTISFIETVVKMNASAPWQFLAWNEFEVLRLKGILLR